MNNYIWERRYEAAIERFQDYEDEYFIEIPHVYVDIIQELHNKRIKACKLRYTGMFEYMTIQDMDIWLKLKEEILNKQAQFAKIDDDIYDYITEEDKSEFRYLCFKDKYC
jgi:hypothetical protein